MTPWVACAAALAVAQLTGAESIVRASESMVRAAVGEVALRQVRHMDRAWQPSQRDCAGLVRYVYRNAFARLQPDRLSPGLWRGAGDVPLDFADAETLLAHNFTPMGRGEVARATLRTGDILAFRQRRNDDADAVYHLMLAVVPANSVDEGWIVYHPGDPSADVRAGSLRTYAQEAPREWQPVAANPAFLGYFRFKDWSHGQLAPQP